jgi:CubicO group peptidase (beta-lactamase class C family)
VNPAGKNIIKLGVILLVTFPLFVYIFSADSADGKIARVDRLFSPWDKPQSPGCALAVIQNGEIILKKGYGLANLDHDVKIRPNTVFRIGSISKQFTAASIQILHKEGKLSLDDSIRKYVPEMPEYDWPITIRHLIHHTSGIRDYEWLQYFKGEHSNQAEHNNEDIIELLARQKGLEFRPGDEFSYSNSGFTLLATVVERISGMPFSRFVKARIFEPLGMKNTLIYDDNTMIIKNRATGYLKGENGFAVNETLNESTGDGGVFTTVEDFFLWDRNFYEDKIVEPGFMKSLLQVGKLNDGRPVVYEHRGFRYEYALGLALTNYKGLRAVCHGGSYVGFRSAYVQFPDQRFSVICFGNLSNFDPMNLCYKVADIFLGECFTEEERQTSKETSSTDNIKKDGMKLTEEQLDIYTGKYYSDELQTYYIIAEKEKHLVFAHANPPTDLLLNADGPDVFSFSGYEMKFIRDASGKVTGFTFQSGRGVKGVIFEKLH